MHYLLMHKPSGQCEQVVCYVQAVMPEDAFRQCRKVVLKTILDHNGTNHYFNTNQSATFKVAGLTHQIFVKQVKSCEDLL